MPPQREHSSAGTEAEAKAHDTASLHPFKVIDHSSLLCTACQSCVWPSQLKSHLQLSHKVNSVKERVERTALLQRLQSLEGLQDLETWQSPLMLERRIPDLPLVKVYKCLECPNKTAKARGTMRTHQKEAHGRCYRAGNSARNLAQRTRDDAKSMAQVYGQYLFKGGKASQCFPVRGLVVDKTRQADAEEQSQSDEDDEVISNRELYVIAFASGLHQPAANAPPSLVIVGEPVP